MHKKRIIPIILLKNGYVVQSKQFSRHKQIGNSFSLVKRMSEWGADELIYLDITREGGHSLNRDDLRNGNQSDRESIFSFVAQNANMPTTLGGGIRTLQDIEFCLQKGADKVSVNTLLCTNPEVVSLAAREFGRQCIVASVDFRVTADGRAEVYVENGKTPVDVDLRTWCLRAQDLGAGELLLNAIDRDGKRNGFDIQSVGLVKEAVDVPVIACGGAGQWSDFAALLEETDVDAVAAANIFLYVDQSLYLAKKYLHDHGLNVRRPEIIEFEDQNEHSSRT